MMKISDYKALISNLPVRHQKFTTKRNTWKNAEEKIVWLKKLNNNLFGDNLTLSISRQDILETKNSRELIIKAIYWGYPRGMRGNHFLNILEHIQLLETTLKKLNQIEKPNTGDFNQIAITFKGITGLGLSTYSKLLYFSQLSFNDNPCLILDKRLIDVFATKAYCEYQQLSGIRYNSAETKYLDFLSLTNKISKDLNIKGENIEQFLFIFGNNLKTEKMEENKISNTWNGYCPESLLKGKTVRMRLNQHDFFESEETGLQICIIPGVQAIILNFRGKGKFRTTSTFGDEVENGELLSPQNIDTPPFNNPATIFGNSKEIEQYIATIQ